jgi:hypothetical protein
MRTERITSGARAVLLAGAAMVICFPVFVVGTWAIHQMVPVGVPHGVATFLLLAATVALIGLTRTSVARALARRSPRPSA